MLFKKQGYLLPVRQTILKNGLTIITIRQKNSSYFKVTLVLRVGSLLDDFSGEAHLMEHLILEGPSRSSENKKLKPLFINGSSDNGDTGYFFTSYTLDGFYTQRKIITRTLLNMVFNPKFSSDACETEKKVIRVERLNDSDEDDFESWKNKYLFPKNPEIHKNILGTTRSLKPITIENLRHFHKKWYGAQNAALIVGGNIRHSEIVKLVEKISIPKAEETAQIFSEPWTKAVFNKNYDCKYNNGIIFYIPLPDNLSQSEYYQLCFISYMLEFDGIGILYKHIRKRHGLSYDISVNVHSMPYNYLEIEISAEQKNEKKFENIILKILKQLHRKGLPPEIFKATKARLKKEFECEKSIPRHWEIAESIAETWSCGLKNTDFLRYKSILNTRLEQLNETFRRCIDLDSCGFFSY